MTGFADIGVAGVLKGVGAPAAIRIGGGQMRDVIISSVGLTKEVNAQFMHTLSGDVHVYVFGDRVGSVEVQGFSFLATCNSNDAGNLSRVIQFYDTNKISKLKTKITISVPGGGGGSGLLTSLSTTFSDPARGIIGFILRFNSLPGSLS